MRVCEDPDILNVIYIFTRMLNLIVIITIVILIIMVILDIIKMISNSDLDTKKGTKNITKRVAAAIIVFLVPSIVNIVLNVVGTTFEYGDCLNNSNREYISLANANKAEEYLKIAEEKMTSDAIYNAQKYIDKITDENYKKQLQNRLNAVEKYVADKQEASTPPQTIPPSTSPGTTLDTSGYYTTGDCNPPTTITVLDSEPNPSCAINYWANQYPSIVKSSDYVYLKDEKGQSLGAWPKDYASIPTQINYTKTYLNGTFIMPVTPERGTYNFVYSHNGIDLMAAIGTPIYAPVDGTLMYSEWGHTVNKGSDETAYTVSIVMDQAVSFEGKELKQVFLTHLSGIRYRCSSTSDCNRKVKKGELVGFVGNAGGNAETVAYAPHLHMSIHPAGDYNSGLWTEQIEKLYNLESGQRIEAGS